MKQCFITIMIALLGSMTLLTACDRIIPTKYLVKLSSPENYQEEIEDVVKYNIASANYICNNSSLINEYWIYTLDAFDDTVNAVYINDESSIAYRNSLEKLAAKELSSPTEDAGIFGKTSFELLVGPSTAKIAAAVLKEYDKLNIILSQYTEISTSSNARAWSFYELNTKVQFLFTIDEDGNWYCEADDDSLQRYVLGNADYSSII